MMKKNHGRLSDAARSRILDWCGLLANVLSGICFLLMFGAACGVIGDVPEHDRIPVAAIFHTLVRYITGLE
jgi:hypothetical protein